MDYELAKQLKDAGFPQGKSLFVFDIVQTGDTPHTVLRIRNTLTWHKDEEALGSIDVPTLEELIEAIGDYTVVEAIRRGALMSLTPESLALYWLALHPAVLPSDGIS